MQPVSAANRQKAHVIISKETATNSWLGKTRYDL